VSTTLQGLPDLDADVGSGIVARRAVIRWGWRLFRREWRQQLLVLGLLTIAVAATIWGASVVTNSQIPPSYPTFGTGAAQVTLPGTDPHLPADIAAIAGRWGPADLIQKQKRHDWHHPVCAAPCREPARALQTLRCSAWPAEHTRPAWSGRADRPGGDSVRRARGQHLARGRHDLAGNRHRAGPEQAGGPVRAGRPGPDPASRPGDHAARPGRRHSSSSATRRCPVSRRHMCRFPLNMVRRGLAAAQILVVEVLGLAFIVPGVGSQVSPCWPSAGSVPSACSARSAQPNATCAWS